MARRPIRKVPALRGATVINLFMEPSTRTRFSFEVAEKRLSADTLNFAAPASLLPAQVEELGVKTFVRLEPALEDADVVMMLRIQRERQRNVNFPSLREYYDFFALTPERFALAAPHAVAMHPCPMNRGVEIDSLVADGPRSVILEQVTNGVAIRMAILYLLAGGSGEPPVDS